MGWWRQRHLISFISLQECFNNLPFIHSTNKKLPKLIFKEISSIKILPNWNTRKKNSIRTNIKPSVISLDKSKQIHANNPPFCHKIKILKIHENKRNVQRGKNC